MAHEPPTELPVKEQPERELADQVLRDRMEHINHKILILSGKGGVGKSTVAANLAMALARAGKRVDSWTSTSTDRASPSLWAWKVCRPWATKNSFSL